MARELARAAAARIYAGSRKELTPALHDPPSTVPLTVVAAQPLAAPASAASLGADRLSDYALSPSAARIIAELPAAG